MALDTSSPPPFAYPSSPLRSSDTQPPTSPVPIASSSSSRAALHASPSCSPSTSRGSYGRSVSLSASPGVLLTYGGPWGDDRGRRRSSSGLQRATGTGSAARSLGQSNSFVGSYEASLLSFRFSTPPSPPVPFRLKLTASRPIASKKAAPLLLSFDAHFFPLADDTAAGRSLPRQVPPHVAPTKESTPATPFVASIDLTQHYSSLAFPSLLPAFPGHPIPASGQLQAVISNANGVGVKVFVVPYDLCGIQAGQRMVLRQNTYEEAPDGVGRRLRASVTLHVCCVASKRARSSTSNLLPNLTLETEDQPPALKYYLHSTIRVVFSTLQSSAPGEGPSKPRTLTVIDMGDPAQGPARFIPWESGGDNTEYQTLRQMRKVAIKRGGVASAQKVVAAPSQPARALQSSSFPLPRQGAVLPLPPLPRDHNHDLLPSPSLTPPPLPGDSSAFAFAKVRNAHSGRASPAPPAEASELSRRLRGIRIDPPSR